MEKPRNFDNTQAYGDYVPLPSGGYILEIHRVEEAVSKTGKPMLAISLEIVEGEYAGYYMEQWRNDNRQDKKWGCVVYQLINDNDGNCSRGFKTFINAVAMSNPDFNPDAIWGPEFCMKFTRRRIGGVFRREQYRNNKGDLKWSTKCFAFRSVEDIYAGVKPPEDKYLEEVPAYVTGYNSTNEEELPF